MVLPLKRFANTLVRRIAPAVQQVARPTTPRPATPAPAARRPIDTFTAAVKKPLVALTAAFRPTAAAAPNPRGSGSPAAERRTVAATAAP